MKRGNREPAFPTSRKEHSPLIRRSSSPRGTVASPAPGGDPGGPLPSGLFDIFRLAARAHGPLSKTLEPFTTLSATVILPFHPLIKLDINRSTDSTHGFITRRDIWRGGYKILSWQPGKYR